MDDNQYEIDDLMSNPLFREWVFNPDPKSDAYWESIKATSPDKSDTINLARSLLLEVKDNVEKEFPSKKVISRIFSNIQKNKNPKQYFWKNAWFYGSAAITLLILAGWYVLYSPTNIFNINKEISYQHLIDETSCELREYVNCNETPKTITLNDGSKVILEPGSRISYSINFGNRGLREVYLDGTAFFDVTKNPESPFIVYANELITKVLGTSFWITKSVDRSELSVEVLTGKVAVSTQNNMEINTTVPLSKEGQIVVTPNQQLVFSRKTVTIRKNLVPNPIIIHKPATEELEFDDVAVSHVFNAIENAYGVEIEFDQDRIGACLVTASLTGGTLYETVEAICDAINARYQVVDTKIVIEGYGCP